jgi:hypothetical protein
MSRPSGAIPTPALVAVALLALVHGGCARAVRPPATSFTSASLDPYVLVLGSAQDGGLPHAACSCPRCQAARGDPSRRRHVASIAIVVPSTGRRYLVDATPDLPRQLDLLPVDPAHARGSVDRRAKRFSTTRPP